MESTNGTGPDDAPRDQRPSTGRGQSGEGARSAMEFLIRQQQEREPQTAKKEDGERPAPPGSPS